MWSLVLFYMFFPIFIYNKKWQWLTKIIKKKRKKIPYKEYSEERVKKYKDLDVIIVGANVSGLITAAALAKCGVKVLVLEKLKHPGGSFRTAERGGYSFDVEENVNNLKTTKTIIDWLCEEPIWWLKKEEPIVECKYKGKTLKIMNSSKHTRDLMKSNFNNEAAQNRFWEHVLAYSRSNKTIFEALKFYHMPQFIREMLQEFFAPNYFEYNQMSIENLIQSCHFEENCDLPQCLECLYDDKKNSAAELLDYIVRCNGGNFYPKNGINNVIDELCQTIQTNGSHILVEAFVESIDPQKRKVILKDGTVKTARKIVSAISIIDTFKIVGFTPPKMTLKNTKIKAFIALKTDTEIEKIDKVINKDGSVYKILFGKSDSKPCIVVYTNNKIDISVQKNKEKLTNQMLDIVGLKESKTVEWVHVESSESSQVKNDINKFVNPCKPTTQFSNFYITGKDIVHTDSLEDAIRSGYITANAVANYGTFIDILTCKELINSA